MKNRPLCAPNALELEAYYLAQTPALQTTAKALNADGDVEQDGEEPDEGQSDLEPEQRQRATRRIKDDNAKAIKFYPPGWGSVLKNTKPFWQYHVAINNPFLECGQDLGDASTLLAEAIDEYELSGKQLEDGMTLFVAYLSVITHSRQDLNTIAT